MKHQRASNVIYAIACTFLVVSALMWPGTTRSANASQPQQAQQLVFDARTPIGALPFTINKCGSYFLTQCLTGVAGQDGITINADDVTIDLNGFSLRGVPGSGDGVIVTGARTNVSVTNGTVQGWGGIGVNTTNAENSHLDRLRSSGNSGHGIRSGGNNTVIACVAESNGMDGIVAGPGSTLRDCTAKQNQDGVKFSVGCTVVNCSAYQNGDDGFVTGNGSTVMTCTSRQNGDDGFEVVSGSTILLCTATLNTGDGIQVDNPGCLIKGNNCENNGFSGDGAGIHVRSNDSCIEGNHLTNNDRGLDVDVAGNLLLENSAANNATNYDIVAGNSFGPIVNVGGVGDISGTANADHPQANFEY